MVSRKNNEERRNRSKHDIYAAILNAANGGIKKTHLMNKANLSFKQVTDYTEFLIEIKLLELRPDGTYASTLDGIDYATAYGKAIAYLERGMNQSSPQIMSNGKNRYTVNHSSV